MTPLTELPSFLPRSSLPALIRSFRRERARRMTPGEWNREFLPRYFHKFAPADFHARFDSDLHGLHLTRGVKRSFIAPRGGAKSTWCTLAYPLRAALEGWEPHTIILSDSSDQADLLLNHIRSELEDNDADPTAWRATRSSSRHRSRVEIRAVSNFSNGVILEALLGMGKLHPWPSQPRRTAVAHHLRRHSE